MNKNRSYITMQLTLADFVLCANERQRDTYIGMLSALGLIDPTMYDRDDTLRRCIDVAGHGIRPDSLTREHRVLKGVYAGIRETDKVILWNGGTVSWYDPEPFLRALHLISKERDDIKALFLGTFYPGLGTSLGYGQRFKSAFQLAKELGLYQRSVFFEFGWVPHQEVKDYLLESDIGICTYFDNLETRYSHRTRFLDIFWAELPIICTRGDVLASMVDEHGLGIVVAEGDTAGVANAIRRLVDDRAFYEHCRENLRAVKPNLSWAATLEPLVRFCREDSSYAVPKNERFLPLLSRVAKYMAARLQDALTPGR
jgi:glycosyltransferase involved in cell wall biosynthesis